MKTALVTGGLGFIGSYVVMKLTQEGYSVVIVDNATTIGGIPFKHPKATLLEADICRPETYSQLEQYNFDVIYHLAAQSAGEPSHTNPEFDLLTNAYGTYCMAKFAKSQGVPRFIYTSTVAVYGSETPQNITEDSKISPDSIYGVSKYSGELFIKQVLSSSDTEYTIFRVFNCFGPGEDLNYLKKGMVSIYASYFWRNKPVVVKGSLDRYRDLTYIEDTVDILIRAKSYKCSFSRTYNLSSGQNIKVSELLDLMKDVFSTNNDYPIEQAGPTEGDSFGFQADTTKLRDHFSWTPNYSIKLGLEHFVAWISSIPVQDDLTEYHPFYKDFRNVQKIDDA